MQAQQPKRFKRKFEKKLPQEQFEVDLTQGP